MSIGYVDPVFSPLFVLFDPYSFFYFFAYAFVCPVLRIDFDARIAGPMMLGCPVLLHYRPTGKVEKIFTFFWWNFGEGAGYVHFSL